MALTKEEARMAIFSGVFQAHKDYLKWSGDWIGEAGVESLLVVKIANELHKKQEKESLKLEFSIENIHQASDVKRRSARKALNPRNRVDIAMLNGKGKPISVVEVKRKWTRDSCVKDLQEIQQIVEKYGPKNGGAMQRGFFVVYYEAPLQPNNHLNNRFDAIEEDLRDTMNTYLNWSAYRKIKKSSRKNDHKTWEYGCHIIEISRRNKTA